MIPHERHWVPIANKPPNAETNRPCQVFHHEKTNKIVYTIPRMSPKQNTSLASPAAAPADTGDGFLIDDTFAVSGEIDAAYATAPYMPPDSGDFHAAFPLENGGVGFVLGDVVGHGPKAAVHAKTLCQAVVGCLLEGLPPDDALGFVNAAAEMSPEFEGFATVVAGTVAPETGEIAYASGGHEPLLVMLPCLRSAPQREREKRVSLLSSTGPPLGVLGGEEATYFVSHASLPPDGTLLLYTDGVTEARRGPTFLGLNRLRSLFARLAHVPPLTLVRKIIGYARAFSGRGRKLRDDAALLVLRRHSVKKTS